MAGNTYLVFSSDNGLHTGEYRLMPGKLTAFDTDIRVPLVVSGPGVPAASTTPCWRRTSTWPTRSPRSAVRSIAGDGHSLLPLLEGRPTPRLARRGADRASGPAALGPDPDYQQPASGSPTTYEAMRTRSFLYVEYADGELEFYDLRTDPFELHNVADRLTRAPAGTTARRASSPRALPRRQAVLASNARRGTPSPARDRVVGAQPPRYGRG